VTSAAAFATRPVETGPGTALAFGPVACLVGDSLAVLAPVAAGLAVVS
jgi:hypothetical protein